MNILYVYAHPEPKSFNGALKDCAVVALSEKGHTVKVSNLYALKFKAVLDPHDFRIREEAAVFRPAPEQIHGIRTGSLAPDILEEIEKIRWADILIFQFPIWWSYMPAILKGWIDRAFVQGFVVDIAAGNVYEKGLLKGKKAMIVATTGSSREEYSREGIHGDLEQHLTIITHNIFEFCGLAVLPSFIVYGAAGLSATEGKEELEHYRRVLDDL